MVHQKSEWYFFHQGSIDGKSEVKMEKCHLVAELKLKMLNMQKVTFSISTPPPGGAFELLLHFSYLRNIAPKSIIQIFDTLSIKKFHWNFAPCISGILNFSIHIKDFVGMLVQFLYISHYDIHYSYLSTINECLTFVLPFNGSIPWHGVYLLHSLSVATVENSKWAACILQCTL